MGSAEAPDDVEKAEGLAPINAKPKLPTKMSIVGADDPFYPREGKTLTWTNVCMTIRGNKKKPEKKLLTNVWGEVPKKQITAIMGPSGSGKTSLLNILSGRIRSRGKLVVEADIRLENFPVDPTKLAVRKLIAFVGQDDSLMATATVREAIRFSAKLRLPRATTEDELNTITTRMIMELGLTACADTFVGGPLIKGISGGERKRTSVGVELVVKPALVFLDEPTSGLDSFSALQLTQVLHKVADAGASVLFTIHQPASEIFEAFDHLILLNKGRVMYQGAVQHVPNFFGVRGHPLPEKYNPADWIMMIAQKYSEEELDKAGYFPTDERNMGDAIHSSKLSGEVDALGNSIREKEQMKKLTRRVSGLTQVGMLYRREFQNLGRDKASLAARFGLTIFLNLLFGLIFQNVGKSDSQDFNSVQGHFGAIVLTMINAMFGSAQPAIFAIPAERPVFVREYSTDHYSVVSYFLARLTIEATITLIQTFVQSILVWNLMQFQAPFFRYTFALYAVAMASTAVAVLLGCSVTDVKSSQEFSTLIFVPQILFSGFFIPLEKLPSWLRWPEYITSLCYGVRIAAIAEFSKCAASNDAAGINCKRILDGLKVDGNDRWWLWLVILSLFAGFRLLALIQLRRKATQFF